jgi:hypothetical protein
VQCGACVTTSRLISDFFFEDGEFADELVRDKIMDLIEETRNPKAKDDKVDSTKAVDSAAAEAAKDKEV